MAHVSNMTDYEKTRAEFTLNVPEHFNFARDVFDRWAEDPNKLALWWIDDFGNERKLTYRYLGDRSKQLAAVLSQHGIKKKDRVMLIMPRLVEWWETNLACIRAGAVVSPGTTMLTAKDLAYRISLADVSAIVCDEPTADKVDQIKERFPGLKTLIVVSNKKREGWTTYGTAVEAASTDFTTADTRSDDPCILYFTSGTTGMPKMTLHTHASFPLGHVITGKFWHDLTENDIDWTLTDTGWAKAAWGSLFNSWNMGSVVFVHHTVGFDPKKTLDILRRYPITVLCAPPTAYRMFILEDLKNHPIPTVRRFLSAGEPLNPEVIDVWQAAYHKPIYEGYGQTETVCVVGVFPPLAVKPGSMGKPSPGFDVAIIDEQGRELGPGKEGDLAIRVKPVRPVGLFKEYWNDEERTSSVYLGDWYLTGDRAMVDEDGYFWFVGRADDVILASGYRIGPFEVESALMEHPAVMESAVVSSPDDVRGEVVKAFIILKSGFRESDELIKEIQDHVKKVTAPYKYPRKIEFVKTLPKTVSGKIRRVELRQAEWSQIHR